MDYTRLTLAEVRSELVRVAAEARAVFGELDGARLNWKPDAGQWSVAQCFDHLVSTNGHLMTQADAALDPAAPRSLWQRLPLWPRFVGRMLVRSQSPQTTKKFKAMAASMPSASAIDAAIIDRFVAQQTELTARLDAMAGRDLGVTMASPFLSVAVYSVLDGWRLIATHNWRHVEQARRVTQAPGFPL